MGMKIKNSSAFKIEDSGDVGDVEDIRRQRQRKDYGHGEGNVVSDPGCCLVQHCRHRLAGLSSTANSADLEK